MAKKLKIYLDTDGRMKVSKALKEVWEWKDAVYEETKGMKKDEVIKHFQRETDRFLERMGYKKVKMSEGVYRLERK